MSVSEDEAFKRFADYMHRVGGAAARTYLYDAFKAGYEAARQRPLQTLKLKEVPLSDVQQDKQYLMRVQPQGAVRDAPGRGWMVGGRTDSGQFWVRGESIDDEEILEAYEIPK